MSGRGGGTSEINRYGRAALGGVAFAFVILVGAPQSPPSYLFAMGMFAVAVILIVMDR